MNVSRKIIWLAAIVCIAVVYFGMGCVSDAKMNKSTANVTHITQDKFADEIGLSNNLVVVDFYATWCAPCKILSPMLDELAASYTNRVKFVKVNIDESPDLLQKYSVEGFPTLLFFKHGVLVDRMLGLQDELVLKTKLDAFAADK